MLNYIYNKNIMGWNVSTFVGGKFTANKDGVNIYFDSECINGGLHFYINSVSYNGRTYTAQRYHYKWLMTVREITFELLKLGCLWDYGKNKPASETHPFFNKVGDNK